MRIRYIPLCILIVTAALAVYARRGESTVEVADDGSSVTVILEDEPTGALDEAASLRRAYQLDEAVAAYTDLLVSGTLSLRDQKEAEYGIGLCRYWTDRDRAEDIFEGLIRKYPDDGKLGAYCTYCRALCRIQQRQFGEAVGMLESLVAEGKHANPELYANAYFQIGKIYGAFLNDNNSARAAFATLAATYPESELTSHPYVRDALATTR